MENFNDTLVTEKKEENGHEKTYVREEERRWIPLGKISWPAILAGVLVVTVSQMLLSLLGLGIGLSTVNPVQEAAPLKGLGTGTIAWWSISMLISLFLGGLTTGRMYQTRSKPYLTWHGLLTWCTFTVFSFLMLTTGIGSLISGTGSVIGTVATAGFSAGQNQQLDLSSITRDAENLFTSAGMGRTAGDNDGMESQPGNGSDRTGVREEGRNSQNTNASNTTGTREATRNSQNVNAGTQQGMRNGLGNPYVLGEIRSFFNGPSGERAESKEALINTLVTEGGMSRAEATDKVTNWEASYEKLKARAEIKAEQAADAVATASIVGFFALLIGAFVTVLGARSAPQREFAFAGKTRNEYVKTP